MHTRPLQQLPRLCRRAALPASWTPVPRSPMSTDVQQQQQQPLRSCENTAPSAAGSDAVISSPAAKVRSHGKLCPAQQAALPQLSNSWVAAYYRVWRLMQGGSVQMSDALCMHVPCPPDAMFTCLYTA